MRLYFFTEARIIKGKDGNYYNPGGAQKQGLFNRYLKNFSEIVIVCRVIDKPDYQINADEIVNGSNISIFELPYYLGPLQYLIKKRKIDAEISKIIQKGNAYILRLPGNIGNIAGKYLLKRSIPYAVEIVGDPEEVFSSQGGKNPIKTFFRNNLVSNLKKYVWHSSANLYVTSEALQKKYPSRKSSFNIGVSDVKIVNNDIVSSSKKFGINEELKIISIGSLDQMYKGPDILIKAIYELKKEGINISLCWIGQGKFMPVMLELAQSFGLGDKVKFVGHISEKAKINEYLDESDLFVLASRTEGLPRVIIEAFARALPVLASRVGGIPELLDNSQMFDKENIGKLVELIKEIMGNSILYEKISKENLQKASSFLEEVLDEKRTLFFNEIIKTVKH